VNQEKEDETSLLPLAEAVFTDDESTCNMEAHTSTAELASAYEKPSTSIPPSIDEYHPLQSIQYLIQGGTPADHGVSEQQRPGAESSIPAHSRVRWCFALAVCAMPAGQ